MKWEKKKKIFRHLWTHFSQSFSDKNEEFLCSSERKFPELFKTHPTFVYSPLLGPSMACQTQRGVFFETPCMFEEKNSWCRPPRLTVRRLIKAQVWDKFLPDSWLARQKFMFYNLILYLPRKKYHTRHLKWTYWLDLFQIRRPNPCA